jgi:hypothetical protein
LWKIRQVFGEYSREYHLLVADDASEDDTSDVLDRYQHALPMKVINHSERLGHAATVEELLTHALQTSDRLKRDCAVTFPADFSVSPAVLPDIIKRFESGADVVVAESIGAEPTRLGRLIRHAAGWLLRPGLKLDGVSDPLTAVCAVRLVTLRKAMRGRTGRFLETENRLANAELLARTAAAARQIAVLPVSDEHLRPDAVHGRTSLGTAVDLYRAGRQLEIPEPGAAIQRVS